MLLLTPLFILLETYFTKSTSFKSIYSEQAQNLGFSVIDIAISRKRSEWVRNHAISCLKSELRAGRYQRLLREPSGEERMGNRTDLRRMRLRPCNQ